MKNKIKISLALIAMSVGFSTQAALITENFDNGTFNTDFFQLSNGASVSFAGNEFKSYNRGTLYTVDDYIATSDNILTVTADLRFTRNDIGLLGIRGDGLPSPNFTNEPLNGITARIHNFQGGHTGVSVDGLAEYFQSNPAGGDSFYYQPVRVTITDNGSLVTYDFLNLTTNATNQISFNSAFSAGGKIVFSGENGAIWDNISIDFNNEAAPTTDVSEPSMLAAFGLGLFGLGAMRRKKKAK